MRTRRTKGWLVYGTLVGAALGYAIVDLRAASWGYAALSANYGTQALNATIWGAVGGVFVGAIAEFAFRRFDRASSVAWLLFGFLLFAYLLVRPALQAARE